MMFIKPMAMMNDSIEKTNVGKQQFMGASTSQSIKRKKNPKHQGRRRQHRSSCGVSPSHASSYDPRQMQSGQNLFSLVTSWPEESSEFVQSQQQSQSSFHSSNNMDERTYKETGSPSRKRSQSMKNPQDARLSLSFSSKDRRCNKSLDDNNFHNNNLNSFEYDALDIWIECLVLQRSETRETYFKSLNGQISRKEPPTGASTVIYLEDFLEHEEDSFLASMNHTDHEQANVEKQQVITHQSLTKGHLALEEKETKTMKQDQGRPIRRKCKALEWCKMVHPKKNFRKVSPLMPVEVQYNARSA